MGLTRLYGSLPGRASQLFEKIPLPVEYLVRTNRIVARKFTNPLKYAIKATPNY